jgi:hypothetical protein
MPIKNYRSEMPIGRIFESLTRILVSHGARELTFSYDEAGRSTGLTFTITTTRGVLPVRLPARIEKVAQLMEAQQAPGRRDPNQAYRTAWKNIHDWVAAQMALLETEMVKLEEVFLPYILTPDGRSFYDVLERRHFLLGSGQGEEGSDET